MTTAEMWISSYKWRSCSAVVPDTALHRAEKAGGHARYARYGSKYVAAERERVQLLRAEATTG